MSDSNSKALEEALKLVEELPVHVRTSSNPSKESDVEKVYEAIYIMHKEKKYPLEEVIKELKLNMSYATLSKHYNNITKKRRKAEKAERAAEKDEADSTQAAIQAALKASKGDDSIEEITATLEG